MSHTAAFRTSSRDASHKINVKNLVPGAAKGELAEDHRNLCKFPHLLSVLAAGRDKSSLTCRRVSASGAEW